MSTSTEPNKLLPELYEYIAAWAATELLSGLLAHPQLVGALRQGVADTDTDLGKLTGASPRQIRSLLQALQVERFVSKTIDGTWCLTELGDAATGELAGWLRLLVRGYGSYLHHAEDLWVGQADQTWRDMRAVGTASTEISQHGALPLTARLINEFRPSARLVVDVGCADAVYIAELCKAIPELHGVGVEPSADLRQEAQKLLSRYELQDRVTLAESLEALSPDLNPDVLIFGFSLHEIAEQQGRPAVAALLRHIGQGHPESLIIVIEVDRPDRADARAMRSDSYLRGYYNVYGLLHDFTDQTLLTREEWRELYAEAGFAILAEQAIDPAYDPTGLEYGSVLTWTSQQAPEED